MHGKYGDWNHSISTQSSRGHSFFWKEVCRHASVVLDCTSWMIGDGTSVDVLQDSWIADLPLSRWPTYVTTDIPNGMRVCDLLSHDHSDWNHPLASSFFGGELYRRITSIPLIPSRSTDTRVWRRSCLSRAPIGDLLRIYRPMPLHVMDSAWIWHLPIHPRVRLFIWKLLWNVLPTCSLLSRRGMRITPTCPVCSLEEETVEHAIFSCPRARQIWHRLGAWPWLQGLDSRRISFLRYLRQVMGRGNHQLGPTLAYVAHQIWLSRNQFVFSDVLTPSYRVVRTAASLSTEYTLHQKPIDVDCPGLWDSHAAPAAHRHTVYISWEPPPPGFVKINFDGSVRGRCAGSAFVIRGPEGSLLAAGGFGLLDSSVPLAELYAAWAGISHALRSLGVRKLIIEGDSATVISWLRQESNVHRPTIPLISDIRHLLQGAVSVQIRHIYREANSAADWIAARVAYHSGFWSWNHGDPCPLILSHILYSDTSGLTHPRLV